MNLGSKNRSPKCLHHGTILLDVNMENMQRFLNPNKLKLISKGIDSVRSRVLNLKEKFVIATSENVYDVLEKEFLKYYDITDRSEYTREELPKENHSDVNNKTLELYKNYNSWEWKFGESPEFTNSLCHKFDFGLIDLSVRVEKGSIQEATIFSDCLNTEFIDKIISNLSKIAGRFPYSPEGLDKLFKELIVNSPEYEEQLEIMKKEFISQL